MVPNYQTSRCHTQKLVIWREELACHNSTSAVSKMHSAVTQRIGQKLQLFCDIICNNTVLCLYVPPSNSPDAGNPHWMSLKYLNAKQRGTDVVLHKNYSLMHFSCQRKIPSRRQGTELGPQTSHDSSLPFTKSPTPALNTCCRRHLYSDHSGNFIQLIAFRSAFVTHPSDNLFQNGTSTHSLSSPIHIAVQDLFRHCTVPHHTWLTL